MKKMNRIFGVMCLAALMAVGSTSCKKQETTSSFSFELPSASGFSADEDRAYIDVADNSYMKWHDGDQMMIIGMDENNTNPSSGVFTVKPGSTGLTQAYFDGPLVDGGSYGYFAFYPASKVDNLLQGNYGRFYVPATQTADLTLDFGALNGRIFMDKECVVAAGVVPELNTTVVTQVNHIFGYANVRVKLANSGVAAKNVKSVTITDNKLHLTGYMKINLTKVTNDRLNALKTLGENYKAGSITEDDYMNQLRVLVRQMGYSSEPDGNAVTLNCGTNVPITTGNKCFIIALRPGALINDFTVTLTYDNNDTEDFFFPVTTTAGSKIIVPGSFTNIQCTIN